MKFILVLCITLVGYATCHCGIPRRKPDPPEKLKEEYLDMVLRRNGALDEPYRRPFCTEEEQILWSFRGVLVSMPNDLRSKMLNARRKGLPWKPYEALMKENKVTPVSPKPKICGFIRRKQKSRNEVMEEYLDLVLENREKLVRPHCRPFCIEEEQIMWLLRGKLETMSSQLKSDILNARRNKRPWTKLLEKSTQPPKTNLVKKEIPSRITKDDSNRKKTEYRQTTRTTTTKKPTTVTKKTVYSTTRATTPVTTYTTSSTTSKMITPTSRAILPTTSRIFLSTSSTTSSVMMNTTTEKSIASTMITPILLRGKRPDIGSRFGGYDTSPTASSSTTTTATASSTTMATTSASPVTSTTPTVSSTTMATTSASPVTSTTPTVSSTTMATTSASPVTSTTPTVSSTTMATTRASPITSTTPTVSSTTMATTRASLVTSTTPTASSTTMAITSASPVTNTTTITSSTTMATTRASPVTTKTIERSTTVIPILLGGFLSVGNRPEISDVEKFLTTTSKPIDVTDNSTRTVKATNMINPSSTTVATTSMIDTSPTKSVITRMTDISSTTPEITRITNTITLRKSTTKARKRKTTTPKVDPCFDPSSLYDLDGNSVDFPMPVMMKTKKPGCKR